MTRPQLPKPYYDSIGNWHYWCEECNSYVFERTKKPLSKSGQIKFKKEYTKGGRK